ncbi:GNAT family N-acetyltransferase [Vibrio sp. ZSDZ34]|uniref:GNAT family N-acetyltransferase n=1 Tax=Vibrio gelatinilyticus TaxID=2893468 RepID=A0A9X2AXV9_9VIBR|nr:GNAT family N-acetyltransferase [Vibrio gelatinilyticus]MCJ2378866.1 GNAT family N-acetyltransferase [Vibrio gelatinilyticus]
MLVRDGTLQEVVTIVERISEFVQKESVDSLQRRLVGKRHQVLLAEQDGTLLGFKIGYELDEKTFYSWFGGVCPSARRKGVAQSLLNHQEAWAAKQGYTAIAVKSRNQFPSMLRMLIANHYLIADYQLKEPLLESRIHFVKDLQKQAP